MKPNLIFALILLAAVSWGCAVTKSSRTAEGVAHAEPAIRSFVAVFGSTNDAQFRLYTDAASGATNVFNTFDIEACGKMLLKSTSGAAQGMGASNDCLQNILIDGRGPDLSPTNGMTVIEQASGPDWRYLALDVSAAYRGRLEHFKRSILFVEPDLFILYDHLDAREPVGFKMLLHPSAATSLETNWGEMQLDLPEAGLTIHSPGRKRNFRPWKQVESEVDGLLPGTVTMELGPTNKLATLDVLTVFALRYGAEKRSYAFKLLESNTAVGARIHRAGLPTLVAFKTDATVTNASLTGFGFNGPVGVSVFRPKQRPAPSQPSSSPAAP